MGRKLASAGKNSRPERGAGYNRGLFSVSLAGWPCRVSRRWKNIVSRFSSSNTKACDPPKD